MLMALLVEQVKGMAFFDYLKQAVLTPDDINGVFLARTLRSQRVPGEAQYDDTGLGRSALLPDSALLVPRAYGGEGAPLRARIRSRW